jgi:hypothetical protein
MRLIAQIVRALPPIVTAQQKLFPVHQMDRRGVHRRIGQTTRISVFNAFLQGFDGIVV